MGLTNSCVVIKFINVISIATAKKSSLNINSKTHSLCNFRCCKGLNQMEVEDVAINILKDVAINILKECKARNKKGDWKHVFLSKNAKEVLQKKYVFIVFIASMILYCSSLKKSFLSTINIGKHVNAIVSNKYL